MEAIKARLEEIEYQISVLGDAFAKECLELEKNKGFDVYASKWKKKMSKIADKYATILVDLQEEHDEIREYLNLQEELERQKK